MKGAFVSRAMSAALVIAALAVGACDDNPLDHDPLDTDRLSLNPTFMVIPAGRTAELDVRALNAGNEPNFAEVSQQANGCGGPASVTVADNPAATPAEPPGRFLVTAGTTLGASCVIVSAGSVTDTVDVVVVGDALIITSDHSAAVRAGEGGTVEVLLVASDGSSPVAPFDIADVTFASSADSIVSIAADGTFTTEFSGTATITITWSGTEATGTSGLGVVRTATVPIVVVANVPVAAALAEAFPALSLAAEATVEVVVTDALGNQNTSPDEILGITVSSSDPSVTAAGSLVETPDPADPNIIIAANVFVTVTGAAAGSSDISGTVQTSVGDIPFGPATALVLAPAITAISPASGDIGEAVSITGTGLAQAGFTTTVSFNPPILDLFIDNVTATQIDIRMPDLGDAGDYEITVDVGGVVSNSATYTQNSNIDPDEPLNDDPATAPLLALPIDHVGSFEGGDLDDFFNFVLAVQTQFAMVLDWDIVKDLDIIITDAAFSQFPCFAASLDHPETTTCDLAAGAWVLWVNDFDATANGDFAPVSYRATLTP